MNELILSRITSREKENATVDGDNESDERYNLQTVDASLGEGIDFEI